ncbi:MAG: CotS family spore coat protein [Betaproteobacteria bacterium]
MPIHWPDPAVFLAWDLRVQEIKAVQDAYRVVTPLGQFCLKRASGSPERYEVIARAQDHLTRRGFHQFTPFLPTRDGKPFYQHGGSCYYVTEWLPGERPDLSRPEMAVPAVRCLASFHVAAEGFFAHHPLRDHRGQWPTRLAERARELRALQADRQLEFKPDRFTQAFLASVERWAALAEWALDFLDQAGYAEEVEAFSARGGFCHGDPAERNFVWWKGEPFLIDFDTLLVDLPVLDLARLVRRVDQDCRWDQALGETMLDAYQAVRPLSWREKALLLCLLAFPEKYWRAVHRYYRAREGKSRRHLAHRLEEVEAAWGPFHRFLPALANHLGVDLPRPIP